MRIKKITLYSSDLPTQMEFFRDILGFEITRESPQTFSLQVGWTTLIFEKTSEKFQYHYCFLIPSNQFEEAYNWFDSRLNLISLDDQSIFDFESWNARSFYFYDGNGNVGECIARNDLNNKSRDPFSHASLMCLNEVGTTTDDIPSLNARLEKSLGSSFWKGNTHRFGTHGDQEGLLLLVNNNLKEDWFPTKVPTQSAPYQAEVQTSKGDFRLEYSDQQIKINPILATLSP